MATADGSLKIKIDGDDSGFEKELKKSERAANSAAMSIADAYKKAGMDQSAAQSKAWAEVKKAQKDGTTVMINGIETIITANKKLSESIEDVSRDGYGELAESAAKAARGIKTTAKGIATSIKGISTAIGAVSAAVSAAGIAGVKYNASVEQLQTSFEVMTGSAERAAEVVAELRDLGARTPYEFTGLAETVQTLMQYSLASEDAIDATEMIGDIAQGSADKMASIAMAYGQMSSAGKVQLEDVKQMIEAGFNPLLTISEKTGESMASLYDRISRGTLTVSEITDAMITATSAGGQFFQSMEKQSQTLNGQLSTLQDNLQSFGGTLFSGVSTKLQTTMLPMANEMVAGLQTAFEEGGVDGLINAINKQIPQLTTAGVGAVTKMFSGISRKMPGMVKSLLSSLPSVLGSAVELAPQLTDTLFQLASESVEQLMGMLPELAPDLLKGTGKLLQSLILGANGLVSGLLNGIADALKGWGIISKSIEEAFSDAIENADTSHLESISAHIDANVTAEVNSEAALTTINTAIGDIKDALMGVESLTDDEKAKIEAAILSGSGVDVLNETLAAMDIPQEKIDEISGSITGAMTTISGAIQSLGLSEDALARLEEIVSAGGGSAEIQAALESYGVNPEVAATTAETISASMASIDAAVEGLGLDPSVTTSLRVGAFKDRNLIVASLQLMKLDESSISGVLDSYDTISGSLTAKAKGIYKYISNMYTDGIPESDADVQAAKAAVEGLFADAYDRVDAWEAAKLEELELSGLTGEALMAAVNQVHTESKGMITELNDLEQQYLAWAEENAQKSTAFVEGNLDQLQTIVDKVSEISAEIDVLTNEQFNVSRNKRTLVQAGAVQDEVTQLEALAITSAELEERLQDAQSKAGAALDEAATEFATDAEGYAAREKEILEQLALETEAAYAIYNSETQKTIEGMLKSNPELYEEFTAVQAAQQAVEQMQQLQAALRGTVVRFRDTGEAYDADTFFRNLEFTGVDTELLAEKLGLTPEALNEQIEAMLSAGTTDTDLYAAVSEYVADKAETINTAMAKMTGEGGPLADMAPVLSEAIDKEWLKDGITGIDWTDSGQLLKAMMGGVTENAATALTEYDFTGDGETMAENVDDATEKAMKDKSAGTSGGKLVAVNMTKGITSGKASVISAVRSLARAAVNTLREELGIHSPSTVAQKLGGYFGEGFRIGMIDTLGNTLSSLDGIVGSLNMKPRLSTPDLTNAFANMMTGITLNTEGTQKLALYVNGRRLGEVMAEDNRNAQNTYNRSIGMGYGK